MSQMDNIRCIGTKDDRLKQCVTANFRYPSSACQKKWTQSELMFCENEGSERFKINEKGDQLD